MLKVLHIVPYEKYTDYIVDMWQRTIAQSEYICIDKPDRIDYATFPKCVHMVSREELLKKITSSDYDVIVFSSLPTHLYYYLLEVPAGKIIIWQSVGYDIYGANYPYPAIVKINLYKPQTENFLRKSYQRTFVGNLRHLLSLIFKPITNRKKQKDKIRNEKRALQIQNSVMQRINYVSFVLDSEYDLLKTNPCFKARFFNYKYILPTSISQIMKVDFASTKYLLLGNSGDETNNHLDIIKLIKIRNITTPLFVPLAYGGGMEYKIKLIKKLKTNPQNVVLTQFALRDDYLKLLQQCRVAVFGHIRQQALGNVIAMISQGCKVFLYKDSVTYKYYKQIGLYIYSIEEDLTQENINSPLTAEQIRYNRDYFEGEYDRVSRAFQADVMEIEKEITKKNTIKNA